MRCSRRRRIVLLFCCGVAALGCDRGIETRRARSIDTRPGNTRLVVDSVLPVAEALERFQRGLPGVLRLEGAARSRDQLVSRFMAALESGDTEELSRLHISRSEYAFLYYPTSVYTRKPYELPADIAWLLSEQNSRKGRERVMRRLGGKRLGLRGYECGAAVREGKNQFWRACRIVYDDPTLGQRVTKRLFGPIIEREGNYKLLSYSNDF